MFQQSNQSPYGMWPRGCGSRIYLYIVGMGGNFKKKVYSYQEGQWKTTNSSVVKVQVWLKFVLFSNGYFSLLFIHHDKSMIFTSVFKTLPIQMFPILDMFRCLLVWIIPSWSMSYFGSPTKQTYWEDCLIRA